MSHVVCFGLNHQSAPITLLERVSIAEERMERCLADLVAAGGALEAVGLSTCNRTELYVVSKHATAAQQQVLRTLAAHTDGLSVDDLRYYGYLHSDVEAARHLMRVAAGVDSLLVGESQILGQLRRAFERAQSIGTVGDRLNALVGRAIAFGRKVRTETAIARGNISVAAVAEKLASSLFGDLATRSCLMLGAGETAQLAAQHLHAAGLGDLMVINRTVEHSVRLAETFGGRAVAADLLQSSIASADIVVAATGAPHYIVSAPGIATIMAARAGRPLLLIDLSMPRNIDPECAAIPGVQLHSLADLEAIAQENRRHRESEIAQVEGMVASEAAEFYRWLGQMETNRLVGSLRRQLEQTRARTLARHADQFDEATLARVELFSDSLSRALLHDLTFSLRHLDLETEQGRRLLEAARELFRLHDRES
jgi:glutamyl-tRNA reductase